MEVIRFTETIKGKAQKEKQVYKHLGYQQWM